MRRAGGHAVGRACLGRGNALCAVPVLAHLVLRYEVHESELGGLQHAAASAAHARHAAQAVVAVMAPVAGLGGRPIHVLP